MIIRLLFYCWAILWFALIGNAVAAADDSSDFTTNTVKTEYGIISLLSDKKILQPGADFWLAIRFQLSDGWHIYWRNPGDSGLPPQLSWHLPEGVEIGDIKWPAPKAIPLEGLMNYGYEDEAVLLIPATAADLPVGRNLQFSVKANWLICKDICIPEAADLSLTIASGEEDVEGRSSAIITNAVKLLPLPADGLIAAKFAADDEHIILKLDISNIDTHDTNLNIVEDIYFFPEESGIVAAAADQEWVQSGSKIYMRLKRDTLSLSGINGELSGVISITYSAGKKLFYQIDKMILAKGDVANKLLENGNLLLSEIQHVRTDSSANYAGDKTINWQPVHHLQLSLWQAILLAFVGGILLNAMPCVFPILSLKALDISKKAQIEPHLVKLQALSYLAGVVLSFMVLSGVLILLKHSGEILGWGFQLQSPAFVATMIYLFLILGLALSGMFEIPSWLGGVSTNGNEADSTKGSFMTGILAVMVATPCTVPFMAPAIGYAFVQSSITNLLVMVAMGVGLAFPYVLLSYYPPLLRLLPKPGKWLTRFKEFMAFPIYATAAWLLWVLVQQAGARGLAIVLVISLLLIFIIWLMRGKRHKLIGWVIGALLVAYSSIALTPNIATSQQLQQDGYVIEPFSIARLQELRQQRKSVFVNATAAWCITCKVNEQLALHSNRVAAAFKKYSITYLVADWTNYDDEITDFLQSFDRQGVPLYVYYPSGQEPQILPQLLTEATLLEVIEKENVIQPREAVKGNR